MLELSETCRAMQYAVPSEELRMMHMEMSACVRSQKLETVLSKVRSAVQGTDALTVRWEVRSERRRGMSC